MPISKFVLDSLYVSHTQNILPQDESLSLCLPLPLSPSSPSLETNRKRTHDLIDQSFTVNQGPPKRRRMHDSSTEPLELSRIQSEAPAPEQPNPPSSTGQIRRIDLRTIKTPRTKAAIDQFRKFITARLIFLLMCFVRSNSDQHTEVRQFSGGV
ncbi:hypothetical protein CPB85DRAFT_1559329 [Mucidula mucida]|nr:hypothetical protein CPB85DRAFT_1559329 [Mucidula mucida]